MTLRESCCALSSSRVRPTAYVSLMTEDASPLPMVDRFVDVDARQPLTRLCQLTEVVSRFFEQLPYIDRSSEVTFRAYSEDCLRPPQLPGVTFLKTVGPLLFHRF